MPQKKPEPDRIRELEDALKEKKEAKGSEEVRCSRSHAAKTRGRKLQEPEGRRRHFCVARRLVGGRSLRVRVAAIIPFKRGSHQAAALAWADNSSPA
jgi:hypothetical protein